MRESNNVKKSTFSSNSLSLVATMLSILMILTPSSSLLVAPSVSPVAFASHGGDYHSDRSISDIAKGNYNNNQEGEGEEDDRGLIDNMISQQQSPQAYARNINADNKVIIVENCEDGEVIINDNDQVIQTNAQSFNQEAYNQVGEEEEEGEGEEDG